MGDADRGANKRSVKGQGSQGNYTCRADPPINEKQKRSRKDVKDEVPLVGSREQVEVKSRARGVKRRNGESFNRGRTKHRAIFVEGKNLDNQPGASSPTR